MIGMCVSRWTRTSCVQYARTPGFQAMRAIGGVPGLVKSDLAPMLRRFDTAGDGRVSLPTMMDWAGRKYTSAADVENSVSERMRLERTRVLCLLLFRFLMSAL